DLNRKALTRAKEVIRDKSNLELLQLNADFTLPFQDKSFDTIISFETIEHITDQSKLLKEIERILKDDGKFVVSTSNKEVFSSNSNQPINHFHTKEFGISEFKTSLGLVFKKIKYYSQGELQDFEIKKPSSIQSRVNRIVGMLNGRQTSVLNMNDNIPRYFVAVCSKF
ncbi:class I SAM-dependent methyltransferase, partial [Patescibacteria group bacterium]|nr:class I SAM-dependent methyltransferase [Patescibacteria group bacterium]